MPRGLCRYQLSGDFHFITFSCDQRRPYLRTAAGREIFEGSLERMRVRYGFFVIGYVVMPEHVHLLLSEPGRGLLAGAIAAIKLSVARQSVQRSFWLARYYDFNVYTPDKREEKLAYMHRNPVTRGLVADGTDWKWSSCRHYQTGEIGVVEIESEWTAARRERAKPGGTEGFGWKTPEGNP